MISVEARWPWLAGFEPLTPAARSEDPLEYAGYREQLARARERTGLEESVVCGRARVDGTPVVAVIFAFEFMGGSMGEATGRRLVQAIDLAAARRVPLVSLVTSGGARMQEGMRSLVQMQAVAGALVRLRRAGVPHLAVARHPTAGGVWASLTAAADVILGERGATIAFAGARVRGDDGDSGAFLAEGKHQDGAIDALFDESELADLVARYVHVLARAIDTEPVAVEPPTALPGALEQDEGWDAVLLARRPELPRAADYLDAYFTLRVPLSGDRAHGRDAQLECGVGVHAGSAVAYIAQTGAANGAAGFGTARRLLELAERWQIPVLTLIDTPGAENDAAAEADGIGTAIAETFTTMAAVRVPVTSLLIGEGGSGGALALAAPGRLWAVPSSYFSVIAPEGAAAILLRDRTQAPQIASALRLDPAALLELGIIRGIVTDETLTTA